VNVDASDAATPSDSGGDGTTSEMRIGNDAGPDVPADATSPIDTSSDRGDGSDATDVHLGCTPDAGCGGASPVCDTSNSTCVQCLKSDDCHSADAAANALVCDAVAKKCVACLHNSDCTNPYSPVCDNQICRACYADPDCTGVGPAVCLFDGHCAIDDETVYVRNGSAPACSDADSSGTMTMPYCHSQPAIAAALKAPLPADAGATDAGNSGADGGVPDGGAADGAATPDTRAHTQKRLVVMLGTNPLTEFTFDGGSQTLTVVGKNAAIGPGPNVGITVTSGTLYARDLTVTTSGTFTGVVASGGEIHLDRMVIQGNLAGGVSINNAAFQITNSVIAQNGQGQFPTAVSWSGIVLGTIPVGGPAVLVNNTITGNRTGGVVCANASSDRVRMAGQLFWRNDVDIIGACNDVPCCVDGNNARIDPAFDLTKPYHLSAGSMCRAKVPATLSPSPYDIDGQSRPLAAASDCGADEYYP